MLLRVLGVLIWSALPAQAHFGHPGGPVGHDGATEHSIGGQAEFHRQRSYDPEFGPETNSYSCQNCHNGARLVPNGEWIDHGGRRTDGLTNHQFVFTQGWFWNYVVGMYHHSGGPQGNHTALSPTPIGTIRRLTTRGVRSLFGIARIEDIPDSVILANADPDDLDGDGISGRPALDRVTGRVARFGAQPKHSDLAGFLIEGGGLEFGYTKQEIAASPRLQREFEEIIGFLHALPVPQPVLRFGTEEERARGEQTFSELGCDSCHVRDLGGARNLYSDLLLHDLGAESSDGLAFGTARHTEARTAPLGAFEPTGGEMRRMRAGDANGIDQIMMRHGGEAAASREAYSKLQYPDPRGLRVFLGSL